MPTDGDDCLVAGGVTVAVAVVDIDSDVVVSTVVAAADVDNDAEVMFERSGRFFVGVVR